MSGGYWYVDGADGLHCCWAKSPRYSCPFADGIEDAEPPPPILVEADRLGITRLDEIIRAQHRRHGTMRLRTDDGTLTEQCATCGAKLTRHGFAAWLERELPDDAELTPGQAISARMFGTAATERVGETRYFRTKRKAEEWARKQAKRSKEGKRITA